MMYVNLIFIQEMTERKIILHLDMDSFYASVEIGQPALSGLPVVGADHERIRSRVVSTCSYEARVYGIHPGCQYHRHIIYV